MRQYLFVTSGVIILALAAATAAAAADTRYDAPSHVVLDRGAAKVIAEHEYPGRVHGAASDAFPKAPAAPTSSTLSWGAAWKRSMSTRARAGFSATRPCRCAMRPTSTTSRPSRPEPGWADLI